MLVQHMLCYLGGGGKEKKERKDNLVFSIEAALACLCIASAGDV